jgi:Family of unknown function (DUF6454)
MKSLPVTAPSALNLERLGNPKKALEVFSMLSTDSLDSQNSAGDFRNAIRDLSGMDQATASRRLLTALLNLSSCDVEIVEIGQTPLHLLRSDGTRARFRIHPQGMEIDAASGLLYITAVEMIKERDVARRYPGTGRAHLFECNIEGRTVRSVTLTSDYETEYHPSGMVLIDGTMFIALAQYLPESSATIIKFNVKDWSYEKLFRIQDHVGLVVPNLHDGELLLGNWGSRDYYCTDLLGNIKSKRQTPCRDNMEHQDAQLIRCADGRGGMILATGVTAVDMQYFGLDVIDIANWTIKTSLRWPSAPYMTKGGWAPFTNPTFLWVDSHDRLLALATPDDDDEQSGKDATLVLYMLKQLSGPF